MALTIAIGCLGLFLLILVIVMGVFLFNVGNPSEITEVPNNMIITSSGEVVSSNAVIVHTADKINIPRNASSYADYVQMHYFVQNNLDEDIRAIKGTLTVEDLFEGIIITDPIVLTGNTVLAYGFAEFYDTPICINSFVESEVELYNNDYGLMKFTVNVDEIIYADTPVRQNTTFATEVNSAITMDVVDKRNVDGTKIEFDFAVNNGTSKDIREVQGVLSIKNIFGDYIVGFNCNLTGTTLYANDITNTSFGCYIDQLIDTHKTLYNERYNDLIFEYQITNVIYTDWTETR